jgi:hypothetical protein
MVKVRKAGRTTEDTPMEDLPTSGQEDPSAKIDEDLPDPEVDLPVAEEEEQRIRLVRVFGLTSAERKPILIY